MKGCRTPIGAAWALRAAVLVVGLVASVGLPATAGAATPPSSHDAGSATRTTPPPRVATSSDTPTPTTPVETHTRIAATPPFSEAVKPSSTPMTPTPPTAAVGEAGWVLTVRPAVLTVREGQPAIFTAEFTPSAPGATPIAVRWQTARARTGPWTDLPGPGGTVLASTATVVMDGDLFRAVVSAAQESSSSPSVILHVQPLLDTPSSTPTAMTAAPMDSRTMTPMAKEPYGTVALPVLGMGQEQTATGHDFTPGTMVRVTVEPTGIDLGTFPAGPDGTVTTRFTTRSLTSGSHTVRWTPV
jgi:hypothetical protein